MFYAGTGDMFLPDTMFISSKLVFLPRSCHHCWNLQRLLDPSETTLFHLPRPRVLTSWRTGEVAWQARQPSSFITGNSVMSVMHHRWGWCSRCIHLSPPICGPCAWSEEPHCVFPTICPHASFHSAPCQGGSLHQHCLTASHLSVSSLWSLCPQSSVLSLYTVCSLVYVAPSVPGSQLSAGAGMGCWPGRQCLSICSLHLTPAPGPGVCITVPGPWHWHAPWPMFSSDTICPPPVPSVFQSASHCLKCLNPEKLRWRPILVTQVTWHLCHKTGAKLAKYRAVIRPWQAVASSWAAH